MTENEQDALSKFVENVVQNLEKNGFPHRRVAFPLERMYESAAAKGTSFNKVLDALAARGIAHEKTPEKVIFLPAASEVSEAPASPFPGGANPFAGLDLRALEGLSPDQMMAAAAQFVQQMTPEQLAMIRGLVENLSDAEKSELVERARKLGIG